MSEPTYGEIIKAAREAKGWSNQKFAAEAGLSDSTTHAAENGKTNLTRTTRIKIESALDLSITPCTFDEKTFFRAQSAATTTPDGPALWSLEWSQELKRCRLNRNWTPIELARKADIGVSQIYAFESGQRIPRLDVAMALSDALGIAIEW